MKLLLIKASAPSDFKEYKKRRGSPSQNIFSTAAACMHLAEVELIDETIDQKPNLKTKAELVGIFFHTPDAKHAFELVKKFKAKGKTVFVGGLHPSFMPEEALSYADSVVIGESEGCIEALLTDFKQGVLKKRYEREQALELSLLKPFPTQLITKEAYGDYWTVLVSRGCPYKCKFCVVNPFFGTIRYRPIEHIIAEIKASGAKYIELHSDNLIVNKEYAKALFKALIPLKIHWSVATDISIAHDKELLQLAAQSGLHYVLIGIETPSQEALKENAKGFVKPEQIKEDIKRLHEYGIIVDSAMMFGFDTHDTSIFERSLHFATDVGIDVCEPVIQIPFPGTKLFQSLDKEKRILTYDWSLYDGTHVVYQPKLMSPKELLNGQEWFYYEFNSTSRYLKRKMKQLGYLGSNIFYT